MPGLPGKIAPNPATAKNILPHGLLRSFRIGKTSFACSMLSVDSKCLTTFHEVKKVRMNYKCLSMFFLFGVKGGLLFLITKKEKSPLKPRCSLNNKKALGRLGRERNLKPKWV